MRLPAPSTYRTSGMLEQHLPFVEPVEPATEPALGLRVKGATWSVSTMARSMQA